MSSPVHPNYNYLFKIVVVGDSAVGKTSLVTRFAHNGFYLDTKPTVGVSFDNKTIEVEGQTIKAQIWDTAGTERFRAIRPAYYRRALGALLVYDITRYRTFERLGQWLKEIREYADNNLVVMVVGNKSDLAHMRAVTADDAMAFVEQHNFAFIETSALDTSGVDTAFQSFLKEIYRNMSHRNQTAQDNINKPSAEPAVHWLSRGTKVVIEEDNRKNNCCAAV